MARASKKVRISSDAEEDEDASQQQSRPSSSSKAIKQQAESGDEFEFEEDEDELNTKTKIEEVVLERGQDGYVAGSVVRVACYDFLVYSSVEVRPGPYLNMIIGANGTGKSTLSCAIALALGFPPKVLGRADKAKDFVRNGTEEGWVEVELKGRAGQKNTTIRRHFQSKTNSSTYKMDGRTSTQREVQAKVESFKIQAGNLCTYLPQDKVASFAKMSSEELLKATQEAADAGGLTRWHRQLIDWGKEEKGLKTVVESGKKELDSLKHRNGLMQKEVEALEARAVHEKQIRVLKCLYEWAQYSVLKKEFIDAKSDKTALGNELKEIEAKHKPVKDTLSLLSAIVARNAEQAKKESKKSTKASKEIENITDALEKTEGKMKQVRDTLKKINSDVKSRHERVDNLRKKIKALEQETATPPPDADASGINAKILAKEEERRELALALADRESEVKNVERSINGHSSEIKHLDHRLGNANSVQLQRERDFAQFEPNVWPCVGWMREAKAAGKFVGNVYEPARLSCSIKEQYVKIGGMAEHPISLATAKTFLFEQKVDYDLFMDANANKERTVGARVVKMRPSGAILGANMTSVESVQRKFTQEQLKAWGFDCLSIDLMTGPPAVLAYLADEGNMADFPVAFDKRRIKTELIEKASQPPSRYYSSDEVTYLRRSKYGSRQLSTETRVLPRDAKIFGKSSNSELVAELTQKRRETEAQREEANNRLDLCRRAVGEKRQEAHEIESDLKDLKQNRDLLKKPLDKYKQKQTELKAKRNMLEAELKKPTAEVQKQQNQKLLAGHIDRRYELVMKEHVFADMAMKAAQSSVEAQLRLVQVEADALTLRTTVDDLGEEIEGKRAELQQAALRSQAKKAKAEEAGAVAQQLLEEFEEPEENADIVARISEDPAPDEVGTLLAEEEAKLEASAGINPDVLVRFKKRSAEIAVKQADYDKAHDKLLKLTGQIADVKNQWLPALRELVEAVSSNYSKTFKAMNRAGEVQIAEHEDYDKWGIQILVAFRAGEELQVLTAQRQSGGERSLSTIVYLMSLAALVKSPFALVDEINQGMDALTERAVHNHLVRATCDSSAGQYFLITPKLLSNLDYHERMRVLIVNNGYWLPKQINLKAIVAKRVDVNSRTNGRGRNGYDSGYNTLVDVAA